ncbi:MAG: hypothetical protein JNK82_43435 [Myxococcaceae bacterium]|nr:hypothetical protein [Myxococcaceae bacterium]
MRLEYTAIVCCLAAGCATLSNKGDVDALKPTLDYFHGEMRFRNFRTVEKLIVPEKRAAFTKAAMARDDETNLFVTDFQLEDCTLNEKDGTLAVCMSKVSWHRLPSTSVKTVMVATTLKWEGGQWLVDRQSDGPFAEELSIETARPEKKAPAPAPEPTEKSEP